ncbi:unnamed protein product [Prorocentrum cordatum]|uniref:Uncharacterized protein n=1 Tax=Prorocentrum cordatum TaxID=2364126 RepID=A0ABN9RBU0_9DINO|nr:unnamed protein product [Polarella glacialis]
MGADACADREAASAGRANSAGGPTDRFIMVWVGGTSKKDGAEAASGLEPKARRGKQRIARKPTVLANVNQYHRRHLMARSSMTMRTRAASTERKTERATPSPSPRRPAARDREPGAARHAPRRGARQSPAPILRV